MFSRRLIVAAVAAVAPLTLSPLHRADAAPPLTESQAVRAYAPLVRLHPDERHLPMNPADFIAGSRLRYDKFGPDGQIADKVDSAKLGSGGYEFDGHRSNDPHDKNTDWFFLELTNEKLRDGTGTSADSLYRFIPGQSLTYWFFYGYSNSEGPINHEGDWERIELRLRPDNRPDRVAFFGHNGHCRVDWSAVKKVSSTHPVVYSALGDHASYPTAGTTTVSGVGTDKRADGGREWNLAKHSFYEVSKRPWFGYTGAWGEIGNSGHTSGPQGPVVKAAQPGDFEGNAC
jgi:hypothetical protein